MNAKQLRCRTMIESRFGGSAVIAASVVIGVPPKSLDRAASPTRSRAWWRVQIVSHAIDADKFAIL
jgi:hypothetical protein